MTQLTIQADGVDISPYVTALRGQNDLTQRVDVLAFDMVQAGLSAIDDKMDVLVQDYTGTAWFGGIVGALERATVSKERTWTVSVQGYAALLDTTLAHKVYNGQTDQAIISDLLSTYRPELTLSASGSAVGIDHLGFSYESLSTCIDIICAHTGRRYYVGPSRELVYFAPGTLSPVLTLTDQDPDGATTYGYEGWRMRSDATQVQNRVIAIGATYVAHDQTETFTGTGSATSFTLARRPHKTSSVVVGGTSKVFGHAGVDAYGGSPAIAALVSDADQTLLFQTAPANGAAITITYDTELPVLARAQSSASFAKYGRWYDGKVSDSSMLSAPTAITRAQTVLDQYAFAPRTVSLRTRAPWTRSGQAVVLTNTPDNVGSQQFLIQQSRWQPAGGGVVVQDLQLIG